MGNRTYFIPVLISDTLKNFSSMHIEKKSHFQKNEIGIHNSFLTKLSTLKVARLRKLFCNIRRCLSKRGRQYDLYIMDNGLYAFAAGKLSFVQYPICAKNKGHKYNRFTVMISFDSRKSPEKYVLVLSPFCG